MRATPLARSQAAIAMPRVTQREGARWLMHRWGKDRAQMDLATRWNHPEVDLQAARPSGRCAICTKCASDTMFTLHERVNPAEAGQTWLLCEGCAAAVVTEVDRAALRTPLRLRIAVGVVAANRRPGRRLTLFDRDYWELMPRQKLDRLIVGFVFCMFALPPILFLLVLALVSMSAAAR